MKFPRILTGRSVAASTLVLFFVIVMTAASATTAVGAQSDLDTTYTPTVTDPSQPVVFDMQVQPDGKTIIGGLFTAVNGQPRLRITRLNLDGTLDPTFNAAVTLNGSVTTIKLQPNGKILVAGSFTTFNGTPHLRIVRLNSDGTTDASFNSAVGVDNQIESVALLSDGKILIGGDFLNFGATPRTYIAKLNTDGTLDTAFVPATISTATASGTMRVIVPMADGTIYIGGGFNFVGGAARNFIARLTSTGSNDTTFNPGTGPNSFIEDIQPVAGGQILVGGSFNFWGAGSRNAIVRLNSTGTLDTTFNVTILSGSNIVYRIIPHTTGKFLVAGSITAFNSDLSGSGFRRGIIRINADGTGDAPFNVNSGTNGTVNTTAIQPDGKIMIGGQFLSYQGVSQAPLARLLGTPFTAAGVSLSGRVVTADGRGLRSARVILTDVEGLTRTVATGARGAYRFDDVETGQTYTIEVASRRYRYDPRTFSLTDELTGFDLTPAESRGLARREPTVLRNGLPDRLR